MSSIVFEQAHRVWSARKQVAARLAVAAVLAAAVCMSAVTVPLEAAPQPAPAAPAALFTIEPTAQSTLWVDANKCNDQGPRGAWLSFVVTNTSGATQTGVTIEFDGFTGTNAAYFVETNDSLRTVGTLEPSQSTVAYFYVDYAEVCNHNQGGGSPYTGYIANYTVTVASAAGSAVYDGAVTTGELLDAAAAGTVVSNIIAPTAYVGQILQQTVTYSFGVNGDLFFQPAIESDFNDACWRLVDSAITATTGQVTGVTVPQSNRLWFPLAETKSDGTITVTYYWESLCPSTSQSVTPWAAAKSGQKYKYTGAGGAMLIPPAQPAPVTATKTGPTCVDETARDQPVTYSIVFTNGWSGGPIILKSVTDQLPTCMKIVSSHTVASQVTPANSSSVPAAGAVGTVSWVGKDLGASPGTTYQIPAAGSLTVQFTVDVSACPGTSTAPQYFPNTAWGTVGSTTISAVETPAKGLRIPCSPAAIHLAAIGATVQGDAIEVTWDTASEVDNLGFNLYRRLSPDGPEIKLNAGLIPAQGSGSPEGFHYAYLDDAGLAPGTTYWYTLEDVSTAGVATRHEPVSVVYSGGPTAVALAGFAATRSVVLPALAALAVLVGLVLASPLAHRGRAATARLRRRTAPR